MSHTDTSKYISLILRHRPETIGITLDEHGWANVSELLDGVSRTHPLDMAMLERIVSEDSKQRYSFNEDKSLIRANQGHSIPVDVELEECDPPRYLYHGTGEKYRRSIDEQGLLHKSRLYVHLSSDIETANTVGKRHGKPVVYRVWSGWMHKDGFHFYKSANGVWLTEHVPTKYIKRETFDEQDIAAVVADITQILKQTGLDDEEDTSRADCIFDQLSARYGWELLQQGIFRILLDDSRGYDDWYQMCLVIWCAVLQRKNSSEKYKYKLKRKTIVALLNYRLAQYEAAEDLVWSITCEVFHLDFVNSDYQPMEDPAIIRKLNKYGLCIDATSNDEE